MFWKEEKGREKCCNYIIISKKTLWILFYFTLILINSLLLCPQHCWTWTQSLSCLTLVFPETFPASNYRYHNFCIQSRRLISWAFSFLHCMALCASYDYYDKFCFPDPMRLPTLWSTSFHLSFYTWCDKNRSPWRKDNGLFKTLPNVPMAPSLSFVCIQLFQISLSF